MTPVAIALYAVRYIALSVAAVCIGTLAVLAAIGTALVIVAAGPQFALGASLLIASGFGFGILAHHAYVSSLGWERRGYIGEHETFGSVSARTFEPGHAYTSADWKRFVDASRQVDT